MYRHQGQWRSQFPCYNIVTIPIWMLEFIHENLSKASPQWTCLTSSPPYNLKSYPLWMVKFSRHITACKVQGWTAVILVEMVQDILAKCMCFWKTKFETQIKWTIFFKENEQTSQISWNKSNECEKKKGGNLLPGTSPCMRGSVFMGSAILWAERQYAVSNERKLVSGVAL